MKRLLIIGAGGHGKVVAEAATAMNRWNKIAFIDDRHMELRNVLDYSVVGSIIQAESLLDHYSDAVVAIGDNRVRIKMLNSLRSTGYNLPPIIHPSATVSPSAKIGNGTVILAQATVNAEAKIASGCIINTGATIEHDCILNEGVHISPGACLAGGVIVGELSVVGIGASIIQCISIGSKTIIGAGAAIIDSIPSGVTAIGVPGKVVKAK